MAGVERWTRPLLAATALFAGLATTASCGLLPFDPTPDPAAEPGVATDCAPPFVLHEETTLGALGIGQFEDLGVHLNRVGSVRITEAAVRWEDFAPPDVPPAVPEGQLLCVTWPDGSGLSTLLHEPFGRGGVDALPGGIEDGPPIALAGLAVAVLLVVGVSWLAFRREDRAR
jgi:hypothetical protein